MNRQLCAELELEPFGDTELPVTRGVRVDSMVTGACAFQSLKGRHLSDSLA